MSKFLDFSNDPSLLNDFGIPTDGMEMPWGVSQLNFYYDTKYINSPPRSALELKNYIIKIDFICKTFDSIVPLSTRSL